jgi:hypothetical protein
MQYAWLEKLSSEGYVRPEAREQIYRDCSNLLKHASAPASGGGETLLQAVGSALGNWASNMAGNAIESKIRGSFQMSGTVKKINKNKAAILSHPDFSQYPEKAEARFMDLAKIAPTIAAQEGRAIDLVKEKLHTGFSSQDIGNLAILQAIYTSQDPAFTSKTNKAMEKKAGESLGAMYADVLCIVKEAGIAGIAPGTMLNALRNMAIVSSIPLLAGVGAGAVKSYVASRDSKALAGKLRDSYERALRDSDSETSDDKKLREDPARAYQAFQTLAHFAPHVAMQPTAARSFMKRMVGYSEAGVGIDVDGLKGLSEIERNMSQTNRGESPFFSGFETGAGLFGLSNTLSGTLSDTLSPLRQQSKAMVAKDLGISLDKIK